MKNYAKLFGEVCDRLPDECGNGCISIKVYGDAGENYIVFQSYLAGISRDNLHETVEAVAQYLDQAVPGYRCAAQAKQYRKQGWNYPALWCGKIVVEWNA